MTGKNPEPAAQLLLLHQHIFLTISWQEYLIVPEDVCFDQHAKSVCKMVTTMRPQQSDLELIKVDAALYDGLSCPAGLHEGDDEGRREEVQPLVGCLDPEGSTAHKGQHTKPAVPIQQLAWPWRCDDVCDGLGKQDAPGTCK